METKHYNFYEKHVLPFAPNVEHVDYELVVCFDPYPTREDIELAAQLGGIPGGRPQLWTSHKLTLLKASPFAAVGLGATTAKALLTKFWVSSVPLEVAINLAAYVMYQVKRTIKDVGLDTDILVIRKNAVFHHVPWGEISKMEAWFRQYEDIEQESLYYCLGGDFPQHELVARKGDYRQRERKVRRFFEKLNHMRLQQAKRSLPPPKPTSQKSKPEQ